MSTVLLEGAGLILLAALSCALILGRGHVRLPRAWSPYAAKPLLTQWERRALLVLRAQVPRGFHVCPQVRLADMLSVAGAGTYTPALSRVASKSVDFAIVELQTGRVALVVELDDKSHFTWDRRARDRFVAQVLDVSGVPLARFRPTDRLDVRPYFSSLSGG